MEVLNSEHLFMTMLFVILFGFMLVNMIILGLMLKLYTEILKDRAISKRAEKEPGYLVRELMRPLTKEEQRSASRIGKPRTIEDDITAFKKMGADFWRVHAGNVRQLSKLLPLESDQVTLSKAAAALEDAANFLEGTGANLA